MLLKTKERKVLQMKIKFNWLVRAKNPNFWIGLVGIALVAMGVDASMFTSWQAVGDSIVELVKNPFMLVSVAIAVWGYVQDFTTKGVSDTDTVMAYEKPRCEAETVEDEQGVK